MSGGFGNFGNNDCKVYVGNLPSDIKRRDLEDIFYKYGKVVEVDLHERRESPFAFIEFEDPKDAEDAVRYRDGYSFDGYKIRVEFPRSSSRGGRGGGRGGYHSGGGNSGDGGGMVKKTRDDAVFVTGIPLETTFENVRDVFGSIGDIKENPNTGHFMIKMYEDKQKKFKGECMITYTSTEGADSAVKFLNDHEVNGSKVKVEYASYYVMPGDTGGRGGGRGRGFGGRGRGDGFGRGRDDGFRGGGRGGRPQAPPSEGDWTCPDPK
jgi:RNA recognition motif-containing protein